MDIDNVSKESSEIKHFLNICDDPELKIMNMDINKIIYIRG